VKLRMIALLMAEVSLYAALLLKQAQAIDTSVWIALIAGVVGLLTLLIQTYAQVQLATLKVRQEAQDKKLDDQGKKLDQVHDLTNSTNSEQRSELKSKDQQITDLTRALAERAVVDAAVTVDRASQRPVAAPPEQPAAPK